MTALSSSSHASDGTDAQDCYLAPRELRQLRSDSGGLRGAKKDDEKDTSESALHCTITIRGSGDYLVVETEGCKGAGSDADAEMFCGARGGWADLVFYRKAGGCKTIE